MDETDSFQQLDVLYENQRGITFCGAVYFSEKSLLNFDPAPWVDGNFKASPVNIKTATCPDPSWEWVWQRWYVDMNGDVDESGWQYGFSFGFSNWNGRPISLQSFVRRRRWIRQRKKTECLRDDPRLMNDYFTISSSYAVTKPPIRTQHTGSLSAITDTEEEEVATIPSLLQSLQNSRIDREKLETLQKFLQSAISPDINYLINMKEKVIKSFVYESSCRQAKEMLNARPTKQDDAGQPNETDTPGKETRSFLESI
ncbi:dysferlin-like membrane trafficking protein Mug65 [Schizosaccharomyces osmophilus]|uniref:Dysferlin-like membrane trafficking protein Mug65 n=1 Tax=Schizosaccharomyces osmophilus TaxID=2545709 RepID=A0AAE9W765_9SCHI|nr:dysferlin-like membrane trafficking protein Mug65 [Schizosaccharomyces osmophilus]WBW70764.1 dysferlin-like membrane trafficking protein Mug65 [Schizosaccharomyces osmophilus]